MIPMLMEFFKKNEVHGTMAKFMHDGYLAWSKSKLTVQIKALRKEGARSTLISRTHICIIVRGGGDFVKFGVVTKKKKK